jgi:hypothetical protein
VGEKTETTTSQPGFIGAGHESGHKQEVIARRGLYFANAWSTVCARSPSVPRRQSVCCLRPLEMLGRTGTLDRLEGRQFRTVADAVARFESTSGPGERGSPGRARPGG